MLQIALSAGGFSMSTNNTTRRTALAALAGLLASGLSGCNAPKTGAVQPASPPPDVKIAKIAVDTSALPTQGLDPIEILGAVLPPGGARQRLRALHVARRSQRRDAERQDLVGRAGRGECERRDQLDRGLGHPERRRRGHHDCQPRRNHHIRRFAGGTNHPRNRRTSDASTFLAQAFAAWLPRKLHL